MPDSTVHILAIAVGSALLIVLVALGVYAAVGPRRSFLGLAANGFLAVAAAGLAFYSAVESGARTYTIGYGLAALALAGLAVASVVKPRSKTGP